MSGMALSMGVILADIVVVRKLLAEIESGSNNKYLKSIAAYHVQQPTEKMIKIQIYQSGKNYQNHTVYTHNLVRLTQYAGSIGVELIIPQYIADNLVLITSWEVRGRYDMRLMVRIDRLKHCFIVIEEWFNALHDKGLR